MKDNRPNEPLKWRIFLWKWRIIDEKWRIFDLRIAITTWPIERCIKKWRKWRIFSRNLLWNWTSKTSCSGTQYILLQRQVHFTQNVYTFYPQRYIFQSPKIYLWETIPISLNFQTYRNENRPGTFDSESYRAGLYIANQFVRRLRPFELLYQVFE